MGNDKDPENRISMTDDVPGATTLIKAEVEAKNELLKLVYAELRDLAGLQMAISAVQAAASAGSGR